jgi:hypothetical protein
MDICDAKIKRAFAQANLPRPNGYWFYFGYFYASPAVLAELESRMN